MSKKIVEMLEEISSRKAEIVDQTPFDLFEDNLVSQTLLGPLMNENNL